jgi:hypothetical protein
MGALRTRLLRLQALIRAQPVPVVARDLCRCVGVPNPSPPGHRVFFQPGFTNVTSDAMLAGAWVITGPMWDGGLCSMTMLDCNLDNPGVVYPDPRNPLSTPAVACPPRLNSTNATGLVDGTNATAANATAPAARQPVLRVYYGAQCSLWRPGNAVNCSWDNIKQARRCIVACAHTAAVLTPYLTHDAISAKAFVGGGCVSSTGPTQCMCRQYVPVWKPALRLTLIAADALLAAPRAA